MLAAVLLTQCWWSPSHPTVPLQLVRNERFASRLETHCRVRPPPAKCLVSDQTSCVVVCWEFIVLYMLKRGGSDGVREMVDVGWLHNGSGYKTNTHKIKQVFYSKISTTASTSTGTFKGSDEHPTALRE